MIGFCDTVRTEWPDICPRPEGYAGTLGYITQALAGLEFYLVHDGEAYAELHIDPQHYHVARSVIFHTVPAFVFVDIIPLEI